MWVGRANKSNLWVLLLHMLLISNDSVALCDIGNLIVYNMTHSYFLSQNQQFGENYLLYEILMYGNI